MENGEKGTIGRRNSMSNSKELATVRDRGGMGSMSHHIKNLNMTGVQV